MSNSRYYIVGNNQVWMTQFQEIENCQYESNDEALSMAIVAAQKLGMRGEHAHVCVLDDDGRLRCKGLQSRLSPAQEDFDRGRLRNPVIQKWTPRKD